MEALISAPTYSVRMIELGQDIDSREVFVGEGLTFDDAKRLVLRRSRDLLMNGWHGHHAHDMLDDDDATILYGRRLFRFANPHCAESCCRERRVVVEIYVQVEEGVVTSREGSTPPCSDWQPSTECPF